MSDRKKIKIGGMDLSVEVEYDENGYEKKHEERVVKPDPDYPEIEHPAHAGPPTESERRQVRELIDFFHDRQNDPSYTSFDGYLAARRDNELPRKVPDAFDNMPGFLNRKPTRSSPITKLWVTDVSMFPAELQHVVRQIPASGRAKVTPVGPSERLKRANADKQGAATKPTGLDNLSSDPADPTTATTSNPAAVTGASVAEAVDHATSDESDNSNAGSNSDRNRDSDDDDDGSEAARRNRAAGDDDADDDYDDEDEEGDYNAEHYFDGGEEDFDPIGGGKGDDGEGDFGDD